MPLNLVQKDCYFKQILGELLASLNIDVLIRRGYSVGAIFFKIYSFVER